MQTDSQMDLFRMNAKIKKQEQIQNTNDAKFQTDQLRTQQGFSI